MPRATLILKRALPLAMAASALVLPGCRGWVTDQPPVHLNPNMDTQEKLKPYRKSDFFKNGRAMQMPVEGTVPRTVAGNTAKDAEFLGNDDHMYKGTQSGTWASTFPRQFNKSSADMARGKQRYEIYCAPCHGDSGNGMGVVARRLAVKPPTFHQQRIWDLPVGSIFDTITNGKNWPNMPSYAHQLKAEDRWRVAFYLRALMKSQNPSLPALAPAPPAAESEGDAPAEGEAQQ